MQPRNRRNLVQKLKVRILNMIAYSQAGSLQKELFVPGWAEWCLGVNVGERPFGFMTKKWWVKVGDVLATSNDFSRRCNVTVGEMGSGFVTKKGRVKVGGVLATSNDFNRCCRPKGGKNESNEDFELHICLEYWTLGSVWLKKMGRVDHCSFYTFRGRDKEKVGHYMAIVGKIKNYRPAREARASIRLLHKLKRCWNPSPTTGDDENFRNSWSAVSSFGYIQWQHLGLDLAIDFSEVRSPCVKDNNRVTSYLRNARNSNKRGNIAALQVT